jgi:hypothetical protein
VAPAFSRSVNVRDVSVYGTSAGFRGPSVFVNVAWEYSMTTQWVSALDLTYRHQSNTAVAGYNVSDPTQLIRLNSGASDALADLAWMLLE